MTIYKPNNPERKSAKLEKKLLGGKPLADDKIPLAVDDKDVHIIIHRNLTNTEVIRRRRAVRCMVFLTSLIFVLAIALATALMIHKFFLHRNYMEMCTLNYQDSTELKPDALPLTGSFQEQVELDRINGVYERLDVPPILDSRGSTVVHDFEKNLTAIVDRDHGRCFIMPLDRATVQPPKNFIDLLEKFRSGYYVPNAEVVRETYKVISPPVKDVEVEEFGFYIQYDCQYFDTYRLVKDNSPNVMNRNKRSLACTMGGESYCLGGFGSVMSCVSLSC